MGLFHKKGKGEKNGGDESVKPKKAAVHLSKSDTSLEESFKQKKPAVHLTNSNSSLNESGTDDVATAELPAMSVNMLHLLDMLKRELDTAELIANLDARNRQLLTLFPKYQHIFDDAEIRGDKALMDDLRKELRHRFRIYTPDITILDRMLMFVRFILVFLVVVVGGSNLLLCLPLRWLHPVLRRLGVSNGSLPMDSLTRLYATCILAAGGVTIRVVGKEATERWRAPHSNIAKGLVVYNHSSNLDAFCINAGIGPLSPKFIMKKTIMMVPFFGWISAAVGNVPVNRANREKAVAMLNGAVNKVMNRWGRSVCISPEGTRSKDGFLVLPFKKGAFHMQEATETAFLPLVIHGASDLMPPRELMFRPGVVVISVLDAVSYDKSRSREDTRHHLQTIFASGISTRPSPTLFRQSPLDYAKLWAITAACLWWSYIQIYIFGLFTASIHLGVWDIFSMFMTLSIAVAIATNVFF